MNVAIGLGGGKVLNKLTAILNPCIYILFGGMAIWSVSLVGIQPILDYIPNGISETPSKVFFSLSLLIVLSLSGQLLR